MTKKEILETIAAHPGLPLYAQHGNGFVSLMEPVSKTRLLMSARGLKEAVVGSYISFRPDLKRYYDEGRLVGADNEIILFRTENVV